MAGDPRGPLIHRAAASGAIDFAAADLLEARWWRKLWHTLRVLADEADYRVVRAHLDRALPFLSRSDLNDGQAQSSGDAVDRLVEALRDVVKPWAKAAGEASARGAMASMEESWIRAFGDPKDPAVAARIREAAEALKPRPAPGVKGRLPR